MAVRLSNLTKHYVAQHRSAEIPSSFGDIQIINLQSLDIAMICRQVHFVLSSLRMFQTTTTSHVWIYTYIYNVSNIESQKQRVTCNDSLFFRKSQIIYTQKKPNTFMHSVVNAERNACFQEMFLRFIISRVRNRFQ